MPKLRVIDESGENIGVLSREEALSMAREKELDLVLIASNLEIPVAKIIDWSKFKYEKSKKARQTKSKTEETKEWWFNPNIGDRDLEIRLNKIKEFIEKGGKAKLTVRSKRRVSPQQVAEALDRIVKFSEEFSEPVSEKLREGRNMAIYIKIKKSAPKKNLTIEETNNESKDQNTQS